MRTIDTKSVSPAAFHSFLWSIGADEIISESPLTWWAKETENQAFPNQKKSSDLPGDPMPPRSFQEPLKNLSFKTLNDLRSALEGLTDFALKQTATQLVFGEGPLQPDIMVIGEAPGNEEDQSGRPFVGVSGQLMNRMLSAAGYPRETCYITNMIPWRPPGNRTPTPDEVAKMIPFLREHIRLVQPKSLLLLGGVAAKAVLKTDTGIMRLRGKIHTLEETGIPVVPTFHPSYLLRTPLQKQQAWEDLLRMKERLGPREQNT